MFRSTRKVSLGRKLTDFVWPRRGFRRAWSCHLLRLSRLKACPHKISLGFAAGAFASFLPLVGLHFVIAAAVAFVVRGSIIASAVGTVVGNPITFPMIWYATYKIGVAFTGQHPSHDPNNIGFPTELGINAGSLSGLWQTIEETFWPMLIGALPLGLLCGSGCYLLVYLSLREIRRRVPSFARSLDPCAT